MVRRTTNLSASRTRGGFPGARSRGSASLAALIALVPFVDHELGDLAGYLLILTVITAGAVRLDRWCSRQYWRGLRDYSSGG